MYPHERSLVKKFADKPFVIIGVNSDEDPADVRAAMAANQITWRSFMDGGTSGPIATEWQIRGWPSIFVMDAKGVIRFTNVRGEALDRAVATLLKEMGA